MSIELVMLLDKEIPRGMKNKLITVPHNSGGNFDMSIEDASDILRKNSGAGFDLEGYAYSFWRSNGGLFYRGINLPINEILLYDLINEYKWIFDTVKGLLNIGYKVKLFNGIYTDHPEEFYEFKSLSVNSLKNPYTLLEDFVLYTIYYE